MIRKCKYCGSYFDATVWNKAICGRELCTKLYKKECREKFENIEKSRRKRKKMDGDQLLRDAKAAKDLGVSYGYYMALYKRRVLA